MPADTILAGFNQVSSGDLQAAVVKALDSNPQYAVTVTKQNDGTFEVRVRRVGDGNQGERKFIVTVDLDFEGDES